MGQGGISHLCVFLTNNTLVPTTGELLVNHILSTTCRQQQFHNDKVSNYLFIEGNYLNYSKAYGQLEIHNYNNLYLKMEFQYLKISI